MSEPSSCDKRKRDEDDGRGEESEDDIQYVSCEFCGLQVCPYDLDCDNFCRERQISPEREHREADESEEGKVLQEQQDILLKKLKAIMKEKKKEKKAHG